MLVELDKLDNYPFRNTEEYKDVLRRTVAIKKEMFSRAKEILGIADTDNS